MPKLKKPRNISAPSVGGVNVQWGSNNVNTGPLNEYREISVDRFHGAALKSTAFFLTHAHTDHMVGLEGRAFLERLSEPGIKLYTHKITIILLRTFDKYLGGPEVQRRLEERGKIVALEHKRYFLDIPMFHNERNKYPVRLDVLDANHCPGSAMFLFETDAMRVLHTGDFRLNLSELKSIAALHLPPTSYKETPKPKSIDHIYIDTTFCSMECAHLFPDRKEVISQSMGHVRDWIKRENNWIHLHFAARFAHECILVELYKKFGRKVHVSPERYEVYRQLPELKDVVTLDKNTPFHLCHDRACIDGAPLVIKLSCMWYDWLMKNMAVSEEKEEIPKISSVRQKFIDCGLIKPPAKISPKPAFGLVGGKINPLAKISPNTVLRSRSQLNVCFSMHPSMMEVIDVIEYLKPRVVTPLVVPVASNLEKVKEALQLHCRGHSFLYEDYYSPSEHISPESRRRVGRSRNSSSTISLAASKALGSNTIWPEDIDPDCDSDEEEEEEESEDWPGHSKAEVHAAVMEKIWKDHDDNEEANKEKHRLMEAEERRKQEEKLKFKMPLPPKPTKIKEELPHKLESENLVPPGRNFYDPPPKQLSLAEKEELAAMRKRIKERIKWERDTMQAFLLNKFGPPKTSKRKSICQEETILSQPELDTPPPSPPSSTDYCESAIKKRKCNYQDLSQSLNKENTNSTSQSSESPTIMTEILEMKPLEPFPDNEPYVPFYLTEDFKQVRDIVYMDSQSDQDSESDPNTTDSDSDDTFSPPRVPFKSLPSASSNNKVSMQKKKPKSPELVKPQPKKPLPRKDKEMPVPKVKPRPPPKKDKEPLIPKFKSQLAARKDKELPIPVKLKPKKDLPAPKPEQVRSSVENVKPASLSKTDKVSTIPKPEPKKDLPVPKPEQARARVRENQSPVENVKPALPSRKDKELPVLKVKPTPRKNPPTPEKPSKVPRTEKRSSSPKKSKPKPKDILVITLDDDSSGSETDFEEDNGSDTDFEEEEEEKDDPMLVWLFQKFI